MPFENSSHSIKSPILPSSLVVLNHIIWNIDTLFWSPASNFQIIYSCSRSISIHLVLITFQLPGSHFNSVPSTLEAGMPSTVSKICEVKGSARKIKTWMIFFEHFIKTIFKGVKLQCIKNNNPTLVHTARCHWKLGIFRSWQCFFFVSLWCVQNRGVNCYRKQEKSAAPK